MPELPEVEITRRGIEPFVVGAPIEAVIVRQPRLRYPVPEDLAQWLSGQTVRRIERRAKYLLFEVADGAMLLHLGMSGSLRIVAREQPPQRHDHIDWVLRDGILRLRDPRRFGAVLRIQGPVSAHPLLRDLGIEPLSEAFDATALAALCQGKKTAIKLLLMDAHCVVGVGNIYASESLFRAGIHPATPAGKLSRPRLARLVAAIKATLHDALLAGGSSLRDFVHSDGSSGYFQQHYAVYGRDGEPCRVCTRPVLRTVMGNRATFHCPHCQKK